MFAKYAKHSTLKYLSCVIASAIKNINLPFKNEKNAKYRLSIEAGNFAEKPK